MTDPQVQATDLTRCRWVWRCLDCNAWTVNERRGRYECGHCGAIKPMTSTLVVYDMPDDKDALLIAQAAHLPRVHQEHDALKKELQELHTRIGQMGDSPR